MVERRVALQIRAILVSFRIEQGRMDADVMEEFRRRAEAILVGMEEEAGNNAGLLAEIEIARAELRASDPPG